MHSIAVRSAAVILWTGTLAPALRAGSMTAYDTPYYLLKTDIGADRAREAILRISQMFEEYQRRTHDFAGAVNRKLMFELHGDPEEYLRSSDAPGTAGVYTGTRLLAQYREENPALTWHAVQHEGFHQFVDFAMGGRKVPIWANEGLAEYFGEAIWTGDGFVTGVIPPARLARVRPAVKARSFGSLMHMMSLDQAQWNSELSGQNYDQAWMMVHFLAHADNGRYASAFGRFLAGAQRANNWQGVWLQQFGGDVKSFEDRWRDYWLSLPEDPSADRYREATVATLTSFLGRAANQRQFFDGFEAFEEAARSGKLKARDDEWLPPELLQGALKVAPDLGRWSLEKRPGRRLLICTLKDGRQLEGRYRIADNRVRDVGVLLRPAPARRDRE